MRISTERKTSRCPCSCVREVVSTAPYSEKPSVPKIESDGREDAVVAAEAWQSHKLRNDSVVVDIFQGKLS